MCSGIATLCLEVCARLRHEHLYLKKKNPPNSFQRKLWKFFFLRGKHDEALLVSAAVVSVQCHHEGWVGACFLPTRSLRPWACLHVGLITMPWSPPFLFLPPFNSSLLSVSVLTLALCLNSAFLHGFWCWVFSSPILTTGRVSVYPSDFWWNSSIAMICISSIVYVLCMKFDRGVWITFRMIFCRPDGAFLSVSCFACNRVCACHSL